MSRYCPYCGREIFPDSNIAYYNGGVYHASCATQAQREEREAYDDAQRMQQESAVRQERIARESAAIQEQFARESLWEQQQARMKAEEAARHAYEQKENSRLDIIYRNSLKEAKSGDIDSMVYVAKCLLEGKVVTYSESNAKNWLLKAIEGNSYEALTMIYRVWTSLTTKEKESTISKWDLVVGYSEHATKEDYINIFKCLKDDKNTKEALAFFDRHKEKMPSVKAWIAVHTHKCVQCGEQFFDESSTNVKLCSRCAEDKKKKIWIIVHTHKCGQCGKQFFDENNINTRFCSESCEIEYKKGRK